MNTIGCMPAAGQGLMPAPLQTPAAENGAGFGEVLQASLERVDRLQVEADGAVAELAAGGSTDIHSVMIATEKAGIALELALQIRNKLLNAYETLMRQQI
jgi:flagellar hook-basal body complex protein FliE